MDGDTAGGLSPVGGIDKYFLRKWLHWMEKENTLGLGKISSLRPQSMKAGSCCRVKASRMFSKG